MKSGMTIVLAACVALSACKREQPPQTPEDGQGEQPPNEPAPSGPTVDDESVALNNRGVGLMGRFEYEPARAAFAQVIEAHPDWHDAVVNLGIATLNRQQEGDVERALELFEGVLAEVPDHARANYCAGLMKLYLGPPNDPLPHFIAAAEAAPQDAVAAYYVGQSLANARDHAAALVWFERAIEADPYMRSGYYAASRALRILRRADEASDMLAAFQRLENNPRAHTVEFKYKKMGALGEAITIGEAPVPPRHEGAAVLETEPAIRFDDVVDLGLRPTGNPIAITTCDVDQDGVQDLFVTGFAARDGESSVLLRGTPEGAFELATAPFTSVPDVNAALWGDVDNDGFVDVYLCRDGANQLWRQTAINEWVESAESLGVVNGTLNTVDGALFDADHDGDLDVFCVNDGPNDLLSNNGDGTFRSIGESSGLTGGDRASRQILVTDLDGDRDADIIVIHEARPHEVLINDRLWSYRPAAGVEILTDAIDATAAVAADQNADGLMEIFTIDRAANLQRLTWTGDGLSTREEDVVRSIVTEPESARLGVLDIDGDTRLDVILIEEETWAAFNEHLELTNNAAGSFVTPVLRSASEGPLLIGVDARGLQIGRPGDGRITPYAAVRLSGAEDPGQSMRTNASAIGTRIAARIATRWTVMDTFRQSSGPGQSLQPLAFGLAGAEAIDFVSIDWPDGVFQSELDVPAGELTQITETQRQLSSCPVLFVWNGEKYEFATDLLGVGGIGYAIGPGEYAPPRPWENVLLPEGMIAPTADGTMSLLLTEPMEEACYLDSAALVAYDLPQGWNMVLDERMGIGDPQPTGEPRFYRHEIVPVGASNERGQDVLGAVLTNDLTPADPGALDGRFLGMLQGEHVLTLEFDEPVDAHDGDPMLIADGWVEYPYSQTSFAAWQAGATYDAPTIEARTTDGQWVVVHDQIGYPAGMPRRMSLPLTGLPSGCTAIRLRTNMEVYWDRLAVAYAEPCPQARRIEFPMLEARLTYVGFPKRTDGPFRLPQYDYEDRDPYWDTRYQIGDYTAFGPVTELVRTHDDAVAIFGPGEQISLTFEPTSETPQGWTRRHVLETRGWCKDMDLFTNTGETIGPMPSSGMPVGPRDALHDQYNTRFQAGR